jgi:hypothetical protein
MKNITVIKDEIDNYNDTIFAIIGFMNLFRYDDIHKKMRDDVVTFQGWKLHPKTEHTEEHAEVPDYITPDIGIALTGDIGIIGEVKSSFPMNQTHWMDDFVQLMKYDQELEGWPNKASIVKSHDIVLLLHFSRAVVVRKYYESKKDGEIFFTRPFCIIEFHRSSQSREFFSMRTQYGRISDSKINQRLEIGVEIPMHVFISTYSKYKLYDAKPPLPYLLEIIWTHIVTLEASKHPKFPSLRKNQKIEIEFDVCKITELLYVQFTFAQLHLNTEHYNKQPKFPKQSWIIESCNILVSAGDAEWVGEGKEKIRFKFCRRQDNLEYFMSIYSNSSDIDEDSQLNLFPEISNN